MNPEVKKLLVIAFYPGELDYLGGFPLFTKAAASATPNDFEKLCRIGEELLEKRLEMPRGTAQNDDGSQSLVA